jgi:glucose/arabinose dehydrogenase
VFKKMLKKALLALSILLIAGFVAGAALLNKMGINPQLWLSMPEASQFSGTGENQNSVSISLEEIAEDFNQITDFQFFPGSDNDLLVLQKTGELFQLNLNKNEKHLLAKIDVLSGGEEGLLGVAIHPDYPKVPCVYLNYVVSKNKKDTSQVHEWCMEIDSNKTRWYQHKLIFELEQPYSNHNAGHLIFDNKGLLYIPWGDGGSREDPHDHAQNLQSFLGKILRVNPEAFNSELPYSIPEDNPFVEKPDIPDEIYAYGLRNPWKLAFDTQGRLITADVGQDKWEEITFVEAGGNHGWNQLEALHCFKSNCSAENTVMPFIEYGHDEGKSVTGGYVYLSKEIPELHNKYIYGDFVSGRLWAADLPETLKTIPLNKSEDAKAYTKIYQLGQWPALISSFARDHSGNIYLADFARGKIFKIRKAKQQ